MAGVLHSSARRATHLIVAPLSFCERVQTAVTVVRSGYLPFQTYETPDHWHGGC